MADPTPTPVSPQVLATINASIALVSVVMPEVGALILGMKTIWMAANPGKTEADYFTALATKSVALTSQADAQLIKDGYVQDGAGNWSKP